LKAWLRQEHLTAFTPTGQAFMLQQI
jgi:hypothetical protein